MSFAKTKQKINSLGKTVLKSWFQSVGRIAVLVNEISLKKSEKSKEKEKNINLKKLKGQIFSNPFVGHF